MTPYIDECRAYARDRGFIVLLDTSLPKDTGGQIEYDDKVIKINESCAGCALLTLVHEIGHMLHYLDTGLDGDEGAANIRGHRFLFSRDFGRFFTGDEYLSHCLEEKMGYTDKEIEDAAMMAHEINRVYCRVAMDDHSHLLWKDAPDWVRESAILGVRAIASNPKQSPAASHEGWLAVKRAEGWEYGPVKDAVAKKHPCMVEYDQLPLAQRVKDTLFGAVVRSALGIEHECSFSLPADGEYKGQRDQS